MEYDREKEIIDIYKYIDEIEFILRKNDLSKLSNVQIRDIRNKLSIIDLIFSELPQEAII